MRRTRAGRAASIASALALLFAIGFAGVASASTLAEDSAPSIASDKADYAPGSMVTLTGADWQPGESVHISVGGDRGTTWSREADVTAAVDGTIQDHFTLPDRFVASYSVRAVGATGSVAATSFTDGNVSFALATAGQAAPAGADWSVDWRHYAGSACTTQDGSGTANYSGSTLSSGAQPAVGDNQWAKPVAASAPGYAFGYWSNSASSTTPLTDSQICTAGPADTTLYAHFKVSDGPANQTAIEGTSKAFDLGSFRDTGPFTWSVDVDWGDASHTIFTTTRSGPLGTQDHVYADNGTYDASVTVHRGAFSEPPNPFTVTVSNANPTATLSNSGPVAPGSPVTISFSRQSDPSSADTTTGFRYAFHCDGSAFATAPTYGGSGSAASTGCLFRANGTYVVRARILDKDDGFSEYTTSVTVGNTVGVPAPTPQVPPPLQRPRLMHPFPAVRTEGRYGRRKTTFKKITVKAPKGAHIVARCSHRRCRRTVRTLHRRRTVRLKRMQGTYPPGTTLTIRIGSGTAIGKYVSIRTRRGKPPLRRDSCLPAGKRSPRACPSP